MSQVENDYEMDLEDPISNIAETEISLAENDYEQELEHLTSTVAGKIVEGVQKTDSFFSSACINRVPEHFRKLNKSVYTPKLIAIGPLHREDKHLQTPLQHVKMSYTNCLLSRVITAGMDDRQLAEQEKFKLLIKQCLEEMKTLIDDAKKCYAAEVTLDEEMMLVDGCFILEYLYRCSEGSPEDGRKTRDPICGNPLTYFDVYVDLLLLENRIPFFVLEKLFQLTIAQMPIHHLNKNRSLTDYVRQHYCWLISPPKERSKSSGSARNWCSPFLWNFGNKQENCTTSEEVQQEGSNARYWYHILHVIHDAFMLTSDKIKMEEPVQSIKLMPYGMPSASELVNAGVKFVPGAANNPQKVKFTEPKCLFWWCRSAHFEIPPLEISESLFWNLVALEQSNPDVSQQVSSYVGLMDILVNSDKDVQVLEKAGVMRHYLDASQDASATDRFNKLTKEITVQDVFGLEAYIKATQYSKRSWPRNMAYLKRKYFSSPWSFITFCVGFIVFAITVFQFVRDFHRKNG